MKLLSQSPPALLRNSHIPNLLLNNNKSISFPPESRSLRDAQSQLSTAIGNPFIYMTCHACSPARLPPQQPHGRLARMKSRRPSLPPLARRPTDRLADL